MPDSFGTWLRRERERRGITLKAISDQTKVSVPLFQGLEADDLSQWPAGIFRRGFVRAYATALGLDADDVMRRFESQHAPAADNPSSETAGVVIPEVGAPLPGPPDDPVHPPMPAKRARLLGTAADLAVALILGMGSAAAGSRLLWPVLFIAAYYALGVVLTGTSPMVALLSRDDGSRPVEDPAPAPARPATERRHQSHRPRGPRQHRNARPRVQ
jgi:transcriptional regulator with XRE-family HTH domain